jgi:adhesin transport system outer membrane protein
MPSMGSCDVPERDRWREGAAPEHSARRTTAMRALLLMASALALFAVAPARSEDDLTRLLAQAMATHPIVEGRRAALEASRADREGAEWQRFPTPSLEATTRDSGTSASLLALEQPVWTGGRITSGVRAAGFREDAARSAVVESQETIALRVINAYSELLRQQQRLVHAEASVGEHDRLLAMITRRVEQEVSPPADREFALARLAQARIELSLARQGVQAAGSQLSQLVGQPVRQVADPAPGARPLPSSLDAAVARAIERSPALERLDRASLAAVEDVNTRRSVLQPQLALRLEKQFGTLADNRALVVLRAQPGAGLSAASSVASAQRRVDEARLAREEAVRGLREQVETAWVQYAAAEERVGGSRQSVEMSRLVSESYARQYVAGRKTWIDVLNAVREATQSQFALADALAQSRAAGLTLWLLTGSPESGRPGGGTRP